MEQLRAEELLKRAAVDWGLIALALGVVTVV